MPSRTNYVLIDYENVQPTDLGLLRSGPFKVKIFIGANQAKIPVALAAEMQLLGPNAEYVCLQASGSNALDFHIAYYIGRLSAQDPSAFFHIISKDTGFDPLIKHLMTKEIFSRRTDSISGIPLLKVASTPEAESNVGLVVTHLTKLKAAKPRAEKTLLGTMQTLFKKKLTEQEVANLLALLCKRGIVKLDGTKVSYELPAVP